MKPDDDDHAHLERHAEILREELARDVEDLTQTPAVETAKAAAHDVEAVRDAARRSPAALIAIVGAIAVVAVLVVRAMHRRGAWPGTPSPRARRSWGIRST